MFRSNIIRRKLWLVIAAVLILFSAHSNAADGKIIVGSELDYPPYAIITADGQADGFSVDLMKAVCKVLGIDVTFRVGPWSEVLAALENGEIDALPLVSYSDEREKVFDFTVPHTKGNGVFLKRKGSPGINSADELGGKAIVVMRSDATHDWLLQNGISENLVLTNTVTDALRMLAAGKYDYALAPHLVGMLIVNDLGLVNLEVTGQLINVHGRGYGFAVMEGNSALLAKFNEGLKIIKATGQYDAIYEKWFGIIDPRGVARDVIARYVTWGGGGLVALISLALTWIIVLRRMVNVRTAELRSAHDALEEQVEKRTRNLWEEIGERKRKEEDLRHKTEELEHFVIELNASRSDLERQRSELVELGEKKATLIQQLKYEVDVKNRFFSIISHDLKSPFNSLLGMTQVMSQKAANFNKEKLVEYAANVNESGNRIFGLLQNLLEWSRLQMEGGKFQPEIIPLWEVSQETVDILKPIALEKDIALTNKIKNAVAFADRDMTQSVIRNLIANSLKFTPSGGSVEVSSRNEGDMVQITVADTGVGMSKEQTDGVFALDKKTSTIGIAGEVGTGLGLPLCDDMLKRNGGRIWVESTPGEGSCFHFTLPIEPGER